MLHKQRCYLHKSRRSMPSSAAISCSLLCSPRYVCVCMCVEARAHTAAYIAEEIPRIYTVIYRYTDAHRVNSTADGFLKRSWNWLSYRGDVYRSVRASAPHCRDIQFFNWKRQFATRSVNFLKIANLTAINDVEFPFRKPSFCSREIHLDASTSRDNYDSYCVRLISLRAGVSSIGDSVYLPSSFNRLADFTMYSFLSCQNAIVFSRASMPMCDVNAPAATIAHAAQEMNSRNLQPVASLIRPRVCTRLVAPACPFPFYTTNERSLKKRRAGRFLDAIQIRNRVLQRETPTINNI